MANTKVTGDLIASGTITADNLVSGTLDALLNSYLTTNTYATQGYVTTAVNNLIAAAPASLDTLNELAAALNDDANFATTVTNSLATKLNLSGGTLTGSLTVGGNITSNASEGKLILNSTAVNGKQYEFISIDTGNFGLYDGTAYRLWINGNGNVGIGATSPSQKLDVRGNVKIDGANNGNVANFIMTRTDASWRIANETDFRIYSGGGNTDAAGNLRMQINSAGNTSFTGSVSSNSDVRSQRLVLRSDALERWEGTGDDKAVTINYFGYNTTFDYYRDLNIYNGKGGFIATFDGSSGNVGIGTSSPEAKLSFGTSVIDNKLYLYDGPSDKYGFGIRSSQFMIYSGPLGSSSGGITFGKFDGTTFTENVRFTNAGNVGIGTTSPQAILHTSAPYPTYTDYGTVFYGGTTNNSSQNGIMLASAGNALSGVIGSNLFVNGTNWSQTNTGRSTGWLSMVNTTVAGQTSTLRYNGYVKGTNTTVERFIIDGNGRVGIGTNAPASIFHLKQDAPVLTSESTNTVSGFRINVLGGGSQLLRVQNAGTTKFQIDPNGRIYLGGSTAAANALDDYEEGTWNPNASYTFTHATYTKIGRMVTCQFTCSNPSGMGTVALPFAPSNTVTGSGSTEQVRYVGDVQVFLTGGSDTTRYKYIWQGNLGAQIYLHAINGSGNQVWTATFGQYVSQVTMSLTYITA